MGLAQLHQIRGRVGRSSRHAYAYLCYRHGKALSEIAQKRLGAIREFAAFGSGFKIAMRDLEIRGAGNLLGSDFGSKTELVSAAVESIWSDIFRHPDDPAVFEDTLSCIRWMYRQMEYGSEQYPGFFTHHALGFVRQDTADGKQQMRQTWQHILDALTMVLTRDKKIRPDAFTEEFTRQKFAGILFSLMLSAVVQQDFDPTAVLEIIRRTIYEV